jgi:hypothetical protein
MREMTFAFMYISYGVWFMCSETPSGLTLQIPVGVFFSGEKKNKNHVSFTDIASMCKCVLCVKKSSRDINKSKNR